MKSYSSIQLKYRIFFFYKEGTMDRVECYSPSDWAGGYNLEKVEQIILNFDNGKEYMEAMKEFNNK